MCTNNVLWIFTCITQWIFTRITQLFLKFEFHLSLNNYKFFGIEMGSYSTFCNVNNLLLDILKTIF